MQRLTLRRYLKQFNDKQNMMLISNWIGLGQLKPYAPLGCYIPAVQLSPKSHILQRQEQED